MLSRMREENLNIVNDQNLSLDELFQGEKDLLIIKEKRTLYCITNVVFDIHDKVTNSIYLRVLI